MELNITLSNLYLIKCIVYCKNMFLIINYDF